MIRHLNALLEAHRARRHAEAAEFAITVARSYPNSPVADYARGLAEQELRAALRQSVRTHLGRIGRPVA